MPAAARRATAPAITDDFIARGYHRFERPVVPASAAAPLAKRLGWMP